MTTSLFSAAIGAAIVLLVLINIGGAAWLYLTRPKTPEVSAWPTPPADPWQALPGGRLELGATGFVIELRRTKADPYLLWDPEGKTIAKAPEGWLSALKSMAEKRAAERSEFEPRQRVDVAQIIQGSTK